MFGLLLGDLLIYGAIAVLGYLMRKMSEGGYTAQTV